MSVSATKTQRSTGSIHIISGNRGSDKKMNTVCPIPETATNIIVQSMLIKDTADIKLLTVFEIFREGDFHVQDTEKNMTA